MLCTIKKNGAGGRGELKIESMVMCNEKKTGGEGVNQEWKVFLQFKKNERKNPRGIGWL